jgi:CTP:phosphocholine cytidylyltransferase-like protein
MIVHILFSKLPSSSQVLRRYGPTLLSSSLSSLVLKNMIITEEFVKLYWNYSYEDETTELQPWIETCYDNIKFRFSHCT